MGAVMGRLTRQAAWRCELSSGDGCRDSITAGTCLRLYRELHKAAEINVPPASLLEFGIR